MAKERVQKIIAASGFCSRRRAEELIDSGFVTVNNKTISLGDKADSEGDVIRVRRHVIKPAKKVYIKLNKPSGYITTVSDMYDRKKVSDLVGDIDARIFPVGRLDRDVTGILLMTNDGEWANKMMHPRYGVEKEYLAKLDKPITKDTLFRMNQGFKLRDGFIKPQVKMIKKKYCSLIIHEGRNKIVKRIFNEFGLRVLHLKRVRVGRYKVGRLTVGQWESIRP